MRFSFLGRNINVNSARAGSPGRVLASGLAGGLIGRREEGVDVDVPTSFKMTSRTNKTVLAGSPGRVLAQDSFPPLFDDRAPDKIMAEREYNRGGTLILVFGWDLPLHVRSSYFFERQYRRKCSQTRTQTYPYEHFRETEPANSRD